MKQSAATKHLLRMGFVDRGGCFGWKTRSRRGKFFGSGPSCWLGGVAHRPWTSRFNGLLQRGKGTWARYLGYLVPQPCRTRVVSFSVTNTPFAPNSTDKVGGAQTFLVASTAADVITIFHSMTGETLLISRIMIESGTLLRSIIYVRSPNAPRSRQANTHRPKAL